MEQETESTPEVLLELTIILSKPVNGVEKLELREPTADEIDRYMLKQGKTPHGLAAMYYFISIVAGVPEATVRGIGATKVKEAMRFLLPFTDLEDVFPKTGEKP